VAATATDVGVGAEAVVAVTCGAAIRVVNVASVEAAVPAAVCATRRTW
jgi:hypothetical protein